MVQMLRFPGLIGAAIALAVFTASPQAQAPAQTPQAPTLTPQQMNEEMLKELRAIRMLLEKISSPQPSGPPQPQVGRITNLKGFALGRADAPLTMVEFTDLQCPFCRQYATTTFDEIKKNWIDTGRLRYISRDFPLDFHPQALSAARAARCAGEQGHFWEMRMGLMRNANLLSPEYIATTAAEMKLDTKAFAACTASTRFDAEIRADMVEGATIGIAGTPTFVIGRTSPSSLEGPMIVGAMPYVQFDAKLRDLLK